LPRALLRQHLGEKRSRQLSDVVRAVAEVVLGRYGSATLGSAPLLGSRHHRRRDTSITDPAIEDDVNMWIIGKALDEISVEPCMVTRDDVYVPHRLEL
jgi:hypothetical protein